MDQQNGLFGFLENHVMEPMGKLAQFKVVRAITAAGMAAVPFTIVGSMFLVFSILPQAFSFWPIVADIFSASFDKFTSLYGCKLCDYGFSISLFCSFTCI